MTVTQLPRSQSGVFLLEVLIAIAIFAIGILAMISMQAVSIAAQNDSQYRAEAEHLIDQLTAEMRVTVAHDPTTGNVNPTSFATFSHQPVQDSSCAFSGTASTSTVVTDWIKTVKGQNSSGTQIVGKGLPGVTDPRIQIQTDDATTPGLNQVKVTICWQAGNDRAAHSHSVVAYID